MLHIPLAPAVVASGVVDQRGRALLVASLEVVGDTHFPAGLSHQGRFDKIVTQDLASQRRMAWQRRKAARLGEGLHAQDVVVSPIITFGSRPPGEALEEDRAINSGRELLAAGKQRNT